MRVAVLVSGGGTNLQALIDAKNRGEMPHARLVLVVASKPGAGALGRAAAAGIPAVTLARGAYADAGSYDEDLYATLRQYRAELVVLAGFLTVLGPRVLGGFENRVVNVHPALLPSFGGKGFYGLRVHQAALNAGVKVTGATVHLVTSVIDGGRILLQKAVEVLPGDTPEALQLRVMEQAEWVLLPKAVEMLCKEHENRL